MKNLGYPLLFVAILGMAWAADAKKLKALDVKFMVRGYCLAGSRMDPEAPGGFGVSENAPKRSTDVDKGSKGQLSLVVLPLEEVPFAEEYRGMRLLLINRTKSEAEFQASDSRLSLIQEARDPEGNWKPIEYLPSSWCGNSHHRVFLPAGHFWEFAAPRYFGSVKTKLRFVLLGEPDLTSNEFDGSVNPQQFTLKQGHQPKGIMDPYLD